MTIKKDFWKKKKLEHLSLEEWEALCDGCGICCLYKIEDADTGEVALTSVACRFLDLGDCHCLLYNQRMNAMPSCIKLTPSKVASLHWLPDTCAYRCVLEGRPLPDWHLLVSGDSDSVRSRGPSVSNWTLPESEANLNHLEEYVIPSLPPLKKK